MNVLFPLAVYSSVQRHLSQPLRFPGGRAEWQNPQDQSSAMLNAYLEEWAVLVEQRGLGEKYDAVDGSAFTWEGFWPVLARWYGLDWEGPVLDQDGLETIESAYDPPPRGYGGRGVVRYSFLFSEWATRTEVTEAWREICRGERVGE